MTDLVAGERFLAILAIVVLGAPLGAYFVQAKTASVKEQKIIHYVREKFGIPDSIALVVGPLQDSNYSDFYETSIRVQNGKVKKSQSVLITKDGKLMVMGDVFVTSSTALRNIDRNASVTDKKIIDHVRAKFKVPQAVKLTVGTFHDSEYADFYQAIISAQDGKKKSSTRAFVSKDGRYTVIGSIFDLNVDPRRAVTQTIRLTDQPIVGPVDAPVTIVEFADLECPMCAETQKFIETQLIRKYGNKIRIVFKEYPLVTIHDWALAAAIANECAYQLNPADYFRYRAIIFQSQGTINAANVRNLLLDFGQRAGLDKLKLAGCIDSKASLSRVEADIHEGQKLGINMTPTLFIDGIPVVGYHPNQIYQLIDQELRRTASE